MPKTTRKIKANPRTAHAPLRTKKPEKKTYTVAQLEALKRKAAALYHSLDHSRAKELGFLLLEVRRVSKHGDFKKWLESRDIDRNHASYAMRLANGKHARAKLPYVPTREKLAVTKVKKHVDWFLKFVGNEGRSDTLDAIGYQLGKLFLVIVGNVAVMRKFPLHDPHEPSVQAAGDKVTQVINEFMDVAFKTVTFEDLEAIATHDNQPFSSYMRALKDNQETRQPAPPVDRNVPAVLPVSQPGKERRV